MPAMSERDVLVVIDACAAPDAFEAGTGRRPPLVEALLVLDRVRGIEFCPPAILCPEAETARARGALLVSGDEDGVALAVPETCGEAQRQRLAAHYAALHHTGAALLLSPPMAETLRERLAMKAWQRPQPEAGLAELGFARLQKGVLGLDDGLIDALNATDEPQGGQT